ncbi:MAG: hypothetical protein COW54_13155 [Rhodobacteraceae bacterium CG17_big_fil_post_rev_8_21_14_2_50_63_15]|nr:MAG: hypothetical protein COW54_13155 [Rhodobacteraceae bacterium CG17_big_fil_post_rev_8_21_14_2_50_63_15]
MTGGQVKSTGVYLTRLLNTQGIEIISTCAARIGSHCFGVCRGATWFLSGHVRTASNHRTA